MPHSRPVPSIGSRCHELRIAGESAIWRIAYRLDHDAIVILDVFNKKAQQTPRKVVNGGKKRLVHYDKES